MLLVRSDAAVVDVDVTAPRAVLTNRQTDKQIDRPMNRTEATCGQTGRQTAIQQFYICNMTCSSASHPSRYPCSLLEAFGLSSRCSLRPFPALLAPFSPLKIQSNIAPLHTPPELINLPQRKGLPPACTVQHTFLWVSLRRKADGASLIDPCVFTPPLARRPPLPVVRVTLLSDFMRLPCPWPSPSPSARPCPRISRVAPWPVDTPPPLSASRLLSIIPAQVQRYGSNGMETSTYWVVVS